MTSSTISNILVFQTNVSTDADIQTLHGILDKHPFIQQWNVDQQDVDKVLRVISDDLQPDIIIDILKPHGIFCRELPD